MYKTVAQERNCERWCDVKRDDGVMFLFNWVNCNKL